MTSTTPAIAADMLDQLDRTRAVEEAERDTLATVVINMEGAA